MLTYSFLKSNSAWNILALLFFPPHFWYVPTSGGVSFKGHPVLVAGEGADILLRWALSVHLRRAVGRRRRTNQISCVDWSAGIVSVIRPLRRKRNGKSLGSVRSWGRAAAPWNLSQECLFSTTSLSDSLSSALLSITKGRNTFIREHAIVVVGSWGRWMSF